MKTITVGFSSHHCSAFSWLIRTVTKSTVSHAYVRLNTPYGKDLIFQASGLTVNLTAQDVFAVKARNIEEYDVEVPDEQDEELLLMAVTEPGKPYSMKQIFGFFYVLAMRRLGRRVSNPFSDGNHAYVCVELAADAVGLDAEAESMTPEDLRRYCKENGKLCST